MPEMGSQRQRVTFYFNDCPWNLLYTSFLLYFSFTKSFTENFIFYAVVTPTSANRQNYPIPLLVLLLPLSNFPGKIFVLFNGSLHFWSNVFIYLSFCRRGKSERERVKKICFRFIVKNKLTDVEPKCC